MHAERDDHSLAALAAGPSRGERAARRGGQPVISMRGSVPILMYHALSGASTPGFRRWTLAPDVFEAHLEYLSGQGYQTVTVAELAARRSRGEPGAGDRLIALTFDDAYADFRAVAAPLLARYGMTATVFVPTGYVGGRSGWMRDEGEGGRPVLSWTELEELAGRGIEIGAHSHTHPELDTLPPRELAAQARLSRLLLQDRIGVRVRSFAYPFGHYDRRVRDAVAAAGYSAACTMNSWSATGGDHPLELPRLAVFDDTGVASLAARLAASRGAARRLALRARRARQAGARRASLRSAGPSPARQGRPGPGGDLR